MRLVLGQNTSINAQDDLILRSAQGEMAATIVSIALFATRTVIAAALPTDMVGGSVVLLSWTTWVVVAIGFVMSVFAEVVLAVLHATLRARRCGEAMLSLTPGNIWKMHCRLAEPGMHQALFPPQNLQCERKPPQEQATATVSLDALATSDIVCFSKCTLWSLSNSTATHVLTILVPAATVLFALGLLAAQAG